MGMSSNGTHMCVLGDGFNSVKPNENTNTGCDCF